MKRKYSENRYAVLCVLLFIIGTFSISCAALKPEDRSYSGRTEEFESRDLSPLAGRVIVLDPGHGGRAPGAVGIGGMREKDVNLRVALRLKYYLDKADAMVIMTRYSDRDMIYSAFDSLRGNDLDYRIRVPNAANADLFISLHHNSNLPRDQEYNSTETYYKMEDLYASFDAARLIHKNLVKNIGTPQNSLRPGNYYVLRNNERTAVLGEPSYISNPVIENRLKKDEKIDIEARSYFLGILDYFSRGIPRIDIMEPEHGAVITDAQPVVRISLLEDNFGGGIDPQSIILGIDDKEIPFVLDKTIITAASELPLSNGKHTIYVNAANLKGNHAMLTFSDFTLDLPPENITVQHTPSSIPPDATTPIKITAEVRDRNFIAVKDSTPVNFHVAENPDFRKTALTLDGRVNFYYVFGTPEELHYTITAGDILKQGSFQVIPRQQPLFVFKTIAIENAGFSVLENVRIQLNTDFVQYSNRDGFAYFEDIQPGEYSVTAYKAGYYPAILLQKIYEREAVNEEIALEPMYNKGLFGRKILIDPEFGGLSSGAVGPTGMRASDENLETAQYLVQMLRNAGADAVLTRDRGEDPTPYSRVRLANSLQAQLYVSLRYSASSNQRKRGVSTFAYPTSTGGKRLGSLVIDAFRERMTLPGEGPTEAADYVLQQTGCPALIINLGYISNPETEETLYGTQYNRNQAYTIYTALVRYYVDEIYRNGQFSGTISDETGNPVENALITLDNIFILQTSSDGSFEFNALEPREYSIEITSKGYQPLKDKVIIPPGAVYRKAFRLSR